MITAKRLWPVAVPLVAVIVLAVAWGRDGPAILLFAAALLLGGSVIAAVHHAEVVAHRVGEPFGSLLLAVAVTIIEVGLIVTLMASGGAEKATLARDTVFAAVMITCNGIVGAAILVAVARKPVARFNAEGSRAAFATIIALSVFTLVLPTFTESSPGGTLTTGQLVFVALASLALWGVFVFAQTVRHRNYFLPVGDTKERHAERPSDKAAWGSLVLLLIALVAVVGLAKTVSPVLESAVVDAGLPLGVVGVVIALLVLMPESLAALRAARRGRMQVSFNLAYGSAIASIGLTVPAIALASIWLPGPLTLGLDSVGIAMIALTVALGILTVAPGRATLVQGMVHLVTFAGFLALTLAP